MNNVAGYGRASDGYAATGIVALYRNLTPRVSWCRGVPTQFQAVKLFVSTGDRVLCPVNEADKYCSVSEEQLSSFSTRCHRPPTTPSLNLNMIERPPRAWAGPHLPAVMREYGKQLRGHNVTHALPMNQGKSATTWGGLLAPRSRTSGWYYSRYRIGWPLPYFAPANRLRLVPSNKDIRLDRLFSPILKAATRATPPRLDTYLASTTNDQGSHL